MTTPKSLRSQPLTNLSEYTLSRYSGPNVGLTDIPFGRMTRVIQPDVDDDELRVDLGQSFDFDGNHHGRAVVSSNGYIALGVATAIQLMGSSVYDNTTIPAQITPSGAALIAPWFNDLQTTNSAYDPHGGVWYAKDHGPHGVRSVFRWVCNTLSSTPPSFVTTFECVLCSNGEVQFRYAPFKVFRTASEPTAHGGATIGVFSTGSNRFRDFARDNTTLGGATYDPSFSDPVNGVRYTTSLRPAENFPARAFGAIYSFTPRRLLRRASPRTMIRQADASEFMIESSFTPFDDRATVLCRSGTLTLPSLVSNTAHVSHPLGREIVDLHSQIEITGNVGLPAANSLFRRSSLACLNAPFDEFGMPELCDPAVSFFATGTQPTELPGLSAPLRSKSIVKISLPIETVTTLDSQTASLYYYDDRTRKIAIVASSSRESPKSSLILAGDAKLFGPLGNAVMSGSNTTSGSINLTPFRVSHPLVGRQISKQVLEAASQLSRPETATVNPEFDPQASGILTIPASKFIDRPFMLEKAAFEIPLAAGPGWLNDMTRTVIYNCDLTDHVPLQFSADVGGPCVTIGLMACVPSGRELIVTGTIIPAGDAVARTAFRDYTTGTFNGSQKVVYEWTIEGFTGHGSVHSAIVTPFSTGSDAQFTGTVTATAEARVENGYIALINGANFYADPTDTGEFLNLFHKQVLDLATEPSMSFLHAVKPVGRSMSGFDPSGRSYAGREHVMPTYERGTTFGIANPFYALRDETIAQLNSSPQFMGSFKILPNLAKFVGGSAVSPYVIMPSDKLLFFVAKHRPARSATARCGCATLSSLAGDPQRSVLTGSHDIKINTGSINITLYGTYVIDGKSSDRIPKQAKSVAVSDALCEPISDQFEVESQTSFTGSMFAGYMTGSFVARVRNGTLNAIVTGSRFRIFDASVGRSNTSYTSSIQSVSKKLVPPWELMGDVRNSQCVSGERYYDSMLPAFDGIMRADGAMMVTRSEVNGTAGAWAFFETYAPYSSPTIIPAAVSNGNWVWAYPFEPRYSGVTRMTNINTSITTKGNLYFGEVEPTNRRPTRSLVVAVGSVNSLGGISHKIVVDFNTTGTINTVLGAPNDDMIKVLYGFGDENMRGGASGQFVGPTHFASMRQLPFDYIVPTDLGQIVRFGTSPVIRGWKYGLVNGLPAYSRAVFRRGRFGQFRDMLEQRHDTKFFVEQSRTVGATSLTISSSPVRVQFVDQRGNVTKPELTWSQNLSFEATSSLPYFDGVQRNRPEPNLGTINHGVVTMQTDRFGNVTI